MKDIFGQALLDYYNGQYSEDIITETSISEADVLPLPYLFRNYEEMPLIEQRAIDLSTGIVLDAGCGSGCHSLELLKRGLDVTAIDSSPGAVEVARLRGVEKVLLSNLKEYTGEKFDTILMLMNGAGILGPLSEIRSNLEHLRSLLNPGGHVLADSSDLIYMFDTTEDGGVIVPGDHYYGELEFRVSYKGVEDSPFTWLYLDPNLFRNFAEEAGFRFEVVETGPNFDYLARLTLKDSSKSEY